MEKHILHGMMNPNGAPIDKDIVEKYNALSVADVAKARNGNGVLKNSIRPTLEDKKICGRAVTVLARMGDALWMQGVADVAEEGDIVIVDGGGNMDLSIVGERIMCYMQEYRGVLGVVVDGTVRDIVGASENGFPIWAMGSVARLWTADAPGAINVTIQCGGVIVSPGDLVMADNGGVIVVPAGEIEETLAKAEAWNEERMNALRRIDVGSSLAQARAR